MSSLYRLSIDPSISLEYAWNTLEATGIEILYGSEEVGIVEIFAHLSSIEPLASFQWIKACDPYTLPSIDWEAQWATHGHNFQEGYVHLDFSSFGKTAASLRLQPGSGFGDLSHPTTRLMIDMLAQFLHKQVVIDIGCGSGILSLAALAMGAPLAYGIDIDPQALEHSIQNAKLNYLEKQCSFYTPSDFTWDLQNQPVLLLMNMIRTEQQTAWSSLKSLHSQPCELLTSGVQVEERAIYLNDMAQNGWSLEKEQEEMGWLAFYFRARSKSSN